MSGELGVGSWEKKVLGAGYSVLGERDGETKRLRDFETVRLCDDETV